jgi:hypothetical protein
VLPLLLTIAVSAAAAALHRLLGFACTMARGSAVAATISTVEWGANARVSKCSRQDLHAAYTSFTFRFLAKPNFIMQPYCVLLLVQPILSEAIGWELLFGLHMPCACVLDVSLSVSCALVLCVFYPTAVTGMPSVNWRLLSF